MKLFLTAMIFCGAAVAQTPTVPTSVPVVAPITPRVPLTSAQRDAFFQARQNLTTAQATWQAFLAALAGPPILGACIDNKQSKTTLRINQDDMTWVPMVVSVPCVAPAKP